ncbi:unnamed protein product [Prorocentrum cordatum]|uniref:Uncharacterized protein n=1 Tax=Prorocentrum cordatum TaxID=2364126 RepID=A0ABN9W3P1_9DINO|nr:unnamed protein product [Polarella glacialis]
MWHGMGVSKMSSHMVDLRPLAAQKRLRTHSSVLRQKKSARGALRGAQRAHARGLRGEASIYKLAPLAKCQMGPTVHILRCAEVNNRELQLNNNPRNPSSIVPPHDPARLIHAAALLTGVLGQLCATTARTRDGFRPMGGKEEEEEEEEEEEKARGTERGRVRGWQGQHLQANSCPGDSLCIRGHRGAASPGDGRRGGLTASLKEPATTEAPEEARGSMKQEGGRSRLGSGPPRG